MSRSVVGLDRVLTLLAGLLVVAAGAAVAAWGGGWLVQVWAAAPRTLQLRTASDAFSASWWPWAAGAAGVVAALLALWWLLAHVPRNRVGDLPLRGSGRGGRLALDPSGAAATAADVLAATPGVRSASSRVVRERGSLVVDVSATVEPTADLTAVVVAADAVTADLRQVLGRDDTRARVRLGVARRARRQRRVS
ncbi:hypothetical protein [Kineococcus rubinsiae]|uniref:hypothetical protein n=1 Tax=Kineococcus rubinsiae TaxID=2609562 RepID=UPI00142FEACD|nr:hypothetical protein [Kineococcus rubinsiae]NIZ93341.1 hypothetical protein [Kineococcus rubinsiae]